MFPLLFFAFIVAVKVYKKTAPNGKLTVYLGKRDFVDHLKAVDPIDGVIVVDEQYLNDRKVYGTVATTFRFGREEDEVMGVRFSKEIYLVQEQIYPPSGKKMITDLQEKLIKKLGPNAHPFAFELPPNAPCSVTLQPGGDYAGKPLGVEYELKAYVGEDIGERPHKRNSVGLAIRKVQYAPSTMSTRQPHSSVSKGFALSPGRVQLEVSLDKDLYYHGDQLSVHMTIMNYSKKNVKAIKASVVQTCELTMLNSQYSRQVTCIETKEGCPITPGATLTKVFYLTPLSKSTGDKRGVALDGRIKDEDANLASSTLFTSQGLDSAVGIVVSYSVRVNLNLGVLAGDVVADLPFKLMHPAPNHEKVMAGGVRRGMLLSSKSQQQSMDISVEEFARLRASVDED